MYNAYIHELDDERLATAEQRPTNQQDKTVAKRKNNNKFALSFCKWKQTEKNQRKLLVEFFFSVFFRTFFFTLEIPLFLATVVKWLFGSFTSSTRV